MAIKPTDNPPDPSTPSTNPQPQVYTKAQSIGCLASLVVSILLLVAPKVIALWQGLHSDGTWTYPLIGVLVFLALAFTTYTTKKIPYRSKDMDLSEYPVGRYAAVVIFALSALGMYALYLATIFEW